MLDGINDKPEQAHELAQLLKGHPAKVNLIPFNPFPGAQYERSDEAVIRDFQTILLNADVQTMVRRTRGEDIDAACGQLKGKVADRTRRHADFQRRVEAARMTEVHADAA
jgi:23S rRNA (adenine2503-C2)-methyltransferase